MNENLKIVEGIMKTSKWNKSFPSHLTPEDILDIMDYIMDDINLKSPADAAPHVMMLMREYKLTPEDMTKLMMSLTEFVNEIDRNKA